LYNGNVWGWRPDGAFRYLGWSHALWPFSHQGETQALREKLASAESVRFTRKERHALEVALEYDAKFRRSPGLVITDGREKRIIRDWLAKTGARHVLDAACGTGRLAPTILETGPNVVAADNMFVRLALARHNLRGLAVPLVDCDVMRLPFADDRFDLSLCVRLLHHFEDATKRRAALAELARVSRRWVIFTFDDGTTVASRLGVLSKRLRGRIPERNPSLDEIKRDAFAVGLEVVETRRVAAVFHAERFVLAERTSAGL